MMTYAQLKEKPKEFLAATGLKVDEFERLLPAFAAAGMAGRATHSRDKAVGWLIAFVLYKPAAGTVYAVGFWLIGEGKSLNDLLAGMMTFLIALVALPVSALWLGNALWLGRRQKAMASRA